MPWDKPESNCFWCCVQPRFLIITFSLRIINCLKRAAKSFLLIVGGEVTESLSVPLFSLCSSVELWVWNGEPILSSVTADSSLNLSKIQYLDKSHIWEKLNKCVSYTDDTEKFLISIDFFPPWKYPVVAKDRAFETDLASQWVMCVWIRCALIEDSTACISLASFIIWSKVSKIKEFTS